MEMRVRAEPGGGLLFDEGPVARRPTVMVMRLRLAAKASAEAGAVFVEAAASDFRYASISTRGVTCEMVRRMSFLMSCSVM